MAESDIDLRKTLHAGNIAEDAPRPHKRATAYESHVMNLKDLEANYLQEVARLQQQLKEREHSYNTEKKARKANVKLAIEELRKSFDQKYAEEDEVYKQSVNDTNALIDSTTEQFKTQENIVQQNMEVARIAAIKEMYEQSMTDFDGLNHPDEKSHESIDALEAILAKLARVIEISGKNDEYHTEAVALQKQVQPLLAARVKQISSAYLK